MQHPSCSPHACLIPIWLPIPLQKHLAIFQGCLCKTFPKCRPARLFSHHRSAFCFSFLNNNNAFLFLSDLTSPVLLRLPLSRHSISSSLIRLSIHLLLRHSCTVCFVRHANAIFLTNKFTTNNMTSTKRGVFPFPMIYASRFFLSW